MRVTTKFQSMLTAGTLAMAVLAMAEIGRADHEHGVGSPDVRSSSREYRFGAFSHVDELAVDVQSAANALCWELYRNQRHRHDYRQVYRETYEIFMTADYIHEMIHHNGRRSRVRREVEELDRLFHHVEGHINGWFRDDGRLAAYGPHDQSRNGRLRRRLRRLEGLLHHLMDDVGVRSRPDEAGPGPGRDSEAGLPAQPRRGSGRELRTGFGRSVKPSGLLLDE